MAPKKLTMKELHGMITSLEERVAYLEAPPKRGKSINKVETFNGEVEPEGRPGDGLKQTRADMVVSMQNAMKILNPKLRDADGKHDIYNVCAVCGYTGMMKHSKDLLYEIYEEASSTLK